MELIVAVDREWGIGNKGELLARVRADLKNFKKLTENKAVIYGSKTLSTFPGGKPLSNRLNLVLNPDPAFTVEGATTVHSIDELIAYVENHPQYEYVVIGGASVYAQLLPFCRRAYVTKFDRSFEKDVYFADLDADPAWEMTACSERYHSDPETDTEKDLPYVFTVYERINEKKAVKARKKRRERNA